MKTKLILLCGAAGFLCAVGFAAEAYCPTPVTPTIQYVDETYQTTRTRMVPVTREIEVPQRRWVTEMKTVPCTKKVYVNETYVVNETRYVNRPETRTRQVTRTITESEERQVTDRVYEEICDPATGRTRRVARDVCRTVVVPVKRKVCVEEPYTVSVKQKITVPVTKTRRVAKTVPSTRQVAERRCVTEMVKRQVTVMQAIQEPCTAVRRVPVCVATPTCS